MPEYDVFEMINQVFFDLTKAEKRIAGFVLENRREPQYMSISELAEACQVAEATLTRFCRKLGLKGFNAFKLALAKAESQRLTGASKAEGAKDDLISLMTEIANQNCEAVHQTLSECDPRMVKTASELIYGARRVFCMGQGGSSILAHEAYSLFLTVTPKFSVVADAHLQSMTAALLDEKDLILYFSYSGATRDLMDLLALTEKTGTPIVLVSRFPMSPGARKATVVLKCGSNETPLRSGSVPARMAQLYIIDLLYQIYLEKDRENNHRALEESIDALSSKLL